MTMYKARSRFGGNEEDLSAQGFASTFDPKTLEEDLHTCVGFARHIHQLVQTLETSEIIKRTMIVLITQLRSECRWF